MSRMVLLAFVAACGIPLVFAIQHFRREPPVDTKAALAAPAVAKPASDARDQDPAAVAAAQAKANAVAAALAGPPIPPDSGDGVPAFDIARIEPTGEAVIAGRATPGATVELLRNGELHDRAVADQSGQFVMVPPRFPSGTYDLTLLRASSTSEFSHSLGQTRKSGRAPGRSALPLRTDIVSRTCTSEKCREREIAVPGEPTICVF